MYKRIFQCALLVIGCVSLTTMAASNKQHGIKNLLSSARAEPVELETLPLQAIAKCESDVELEGGRKSVGAPSTKDCGCHKKKTPCDDSD